MEYTSERLGMKLYGLYEFSKLGLFNRPFVVIGEKDVVLQLKSAGFEDGGEIAIRFSKENAMNLPFFLGKFSFEEIDSIISKERKNYVPFVHGLVKTKFSTHLYYDGKVIFIELWPGIGAAKKKVFNEIPDVIRIDDKISIARYLKSRIVEGVEGEEYESSAFEFEFLESFTRKILEIREKLNKLLEIQNPLLCDLNCESIEDINFMGMQKTGKLDLQQIESLDNYYIAKSYEDLKNYDGGKKLFFDVTLERGSDEIDKMLGVLSALPEVYVKSLTMHLAVVLREAGVNVKKGILNQDYEVREFL